MLFRWWIQIKFFTPQQLKLFGKRLVLLKATLADTHYTVQSWVYFREAENKFTKYLTNCTKWHVNNAAPWQWNKHGIFDWKLVTRRVIKTKLVCYPYSSLKMHSSSLLRVDNYLQLLTKSIIQLIIYSFRFYMINNSAREGMINLHNMPCRIYHALGRHKLLFWFVAMLGLLMCCV